LNVQNEKRLKNNMETSFDVSIKTRWCERAELQKEYETISKDQLKSKLSSWIVQRMPKFKQVSWSHNSYSGTHLITKGAKKVGLDNSLLIFIA